MHKGQTERAVVLDEIDFQFVRRKIQYEANSIAVAEKVAELAHQQAATIGQVAVEEAAYG